MNDTLFKLVYSDQEVTDSFRSFKDFCQLLRESNSTLSRFRISYVDLVAILLNLICASREGNWPLHLSSIQEMIPWCFSYNRVNYSRYLPWCYCQMQCLPLTHLEIYSYLMNGGFSCQIGSKNTFGMTPMDTNRRNYQ